MICIELAFGNDRRRLQARAAHRQRLAELHRRGVLAAAGPWDDDSGALLIFHLDDPGARAEIAADPYYAAPGVGIVSIRTWEPVVGHSQGVRPARAGSPRWRQGPSGGA